MSGRITERSEHTLEKIGESLLFGLFSVCAKCVNREQRRINTKRLIHDIRAISGQAGLISNLLCNAFGRFEHRMKVVLVQKLRPTEVENFRVDVALNQRRTKASGPLLCF